jgi:hypothetical protein
MIEKAHFWPCPNAGKAGTKQVKIKGNGPEGPKERGSNLI